MAKIIARNGTVEIGGNTVASIDSITVTETMEPIRSDTLGDSAHANESGDTSWTADVECKWDKADTTGQGAMTIGAEVSIVFKPEGAGAGNVTRTGTALITGKTQSHAKQTMVMQSFTMIGDGALTDGTE